jgi:hypothetical protein
VAKQDTDILQIQKYLNGELDAKAMHQLERRAQADPFLMDALEGFQSTKGDQQANLADLTSRLNQRTEQKKARIIPFRLISIAASVLVICSIAIWWMQRPGTLVKSPVALNVTQIVKPVGKVAKKDTGNAALASATTTVRNQKINSLATGQPKAASTQHQDILARVPPVEKDMIVTAAPVPTSTIMMEPVASPPVDTSLFVRKGLLAEVKIAAPTVKDTTPLNEMIVMGYNGNTKKDTSGNKLDFKNPQQQLVGQAPGVTVTRKPGSNNLNGVTVPQSVRDAANQLMAKQMLQGEVISRDGQPISGAKVKVAGTANTAVTDAKGRFAVKADTGKNNLVIEGKGFQSRMVSANNRDSVKKIALQPGDDSSDLSEIVATGYTPQNKDADINAVPAHPQNGWGSYRTYLRKNAVSPSGLTGTVKISFTIDKMGSVADIKIVKGIDEATNKKAVSIIKDGPGWTANTNRKSEIVTLRIKFSR